MQRTESGRNNHEKFGGLTLPDFKLNVELLFKIMCHRCKYKQTDQGREKMIW